ncbi:protein phosphatase regulatory subunit Gac1 [Blastomyces gilchristii SLH14081]|uniref:Protein phosphatase regulatory subunit Gac1 n=1 Tax=Blastomyces gilchristii (strain SLH14081) TaxID=559298 RepID=A0A179UU96_BLAGS|nr:protein phosphatase regulatory subunit Gac1 [Blastomyces gilchristii SLH14081]OAT09972.1 protein phosphatase regulatory subunit Gac1 [Blastomyces gilchristii SLH14081]
MPYTPPSPLFNSQVRPQPASAGSSPPSVHHGRHKSEPVVNLVGYSRSQSSPPSSSYIYRHRRSPTHSHHMSNLGQQDIEPNSKRRSSSSSSNATPGAALWKSPSGAMIPTGAVISPPDSKSNSSDEEGKSTEGLEGDISKDFEAVIMSIDQNSLQTPPSRKGPGAKAASISKHTPTPLDLSMALATEAQQSRVKSRLKKDTSGVPHPNSSDVATHTPEDSDRGEDEMDLSTKASMVRKKSGELVRPALRPKRRPCSAPGTPVFSKAVHFDSQLEHIRHFLQIDKPLAVSAGSSPVEDYDGDSEFPFDLDPNGPFQSKSIEWEARIANFPNDLEARKTMPVRLERMFLSSDYKNLVGVVSVANISFQKHVVARFTSDYWKTTSEVVAEYNDDVRRPIPRSKPSSLSNSRSKSVPPFPAEPGFKSPPLPAVPNHHRPKSSAVKSSASQKDDDFHDPPPIRRTSPTPRTFGHRYDFGASLSAAMQPGSADQTRRGKHADKTTFSPDSIAGNLSGSIIPDKSARREPFEPPAAASPGVSQLRTSSPSPMRHTDLVSGQPSHQSPLYKELVDKYCFYGSSKTDSHATTHFSRKSPITAPRDNETMTTDAPTSAESALSPPSSPQEASGNEKQPSPSKPTNDDQRSPRHISPSRSPGTPERASSSSPNPPCPNCFTLPYHQSMHMTLSESPTQTFIRG